MDSAPHSPGPPPKQPPVLDPIDRTILQELQQNARATNAMLAKAAGVAESTCSARIRQLHERQIITGHHTRLNPEACGWGVQAMIAVRLSGHNRTAVDAFSTEVLALHEVIAVYNVSGATDFLVHVVAKDPVSLREFALDYLTGRTGVVQVETSMIFTSAHKPIPLPPERG